MSTTGSSQPASGGAGLGTEPGRRRSLVLVTGAGRSGTSTIAGALHYLGYYVPQPVLKKNESNPRGFFESTWPVKFHKRILSDAVVEQTDGRFGAARMVRDALTPEYEAQLRDWMAEQFTHADRLMVKDPRSAWVPQLWERVAASLDADIGFVTMLREPAEVLGSRSTYYASERDKWGDWAFKVKNLCGWVNINLVVEQATRGRPRVWMRYPDLLDDWRRELARTRDDLGLRFDFDLAAPDAAVVDEFIDPTLRRHQLSLADLDMPSGLSAVAEEVWLAGSTLADQRGADATAQQQFSDVTVRYERLMRDAEAMGHHAMVAEIKRTKRETEAQTRAKVRAETKKAAAKAAAKKAAAKRATAGAGPAADPVTGRAPVKGPAPASGPVRVEAGGAAAAMPAPSTPRVAAPTLDRPANQKPASDLPEASAATAGSLVERLRGRLRRTTRR